MELYSKKHSRWTEEEDAELFLMWSNKEPRRRMSKVLRRTHDSIAKRIVIKGWKR